MPQLPSVSRVDDVLGGLLGEVMLGESDMAEEISEQREAAGNDKYNTMQWFWCPVLQREKYPCDPLRLRAKSF